MWSSGRVYTQILGLICSIVLSLPEFIPKSPVHLPFLNSVLFHLWGCTLWFSALRTMGFQVPSHKKAKNLIVLRLCSCCPFRICLIWLLFSAIYYLFIIYLCSRFIIIIWGIIVLTNSLCYYWILKVTPCILKPWFSCITMHLTNLEREKN